MTPHISAKKGEIAKIVLMPGDPLRAKFIANSFLTDVVEVSSIRNVLMYTGKYKGNLISICASGMGQASIGIYSYELFKFYDVDKIIRVGTAGSYISHLKNYDVFLVTSAYSDSKSFNILAANIDSNITFPSIELNNKIKENAKKLNINLYEGRVHSSDVFYGIRSLEETIKITNAMCVEMESAALFANAKFLGKEASCLLTISDNLVTHEYTTPSERQNKFVEMLKIALEIVAE